VTDVARGGPGAKARPTTRRRTLREPAPDGKGAQTRRSILDAAIERFGRDGYRATSVADIARDAGVGGTVAYSYFPNKEALFLAAVDEDAAAVIDEGFLRVLDDPAIEDWQSRLIVTLVEAVDRHPLARRLLAGLEPEVTVRVLDIPALAEVRKVAADRLRTDQLAGAVRTDIDPDRIADGLVSIVLSILMSVVQLGPDVASQRAPEVLAVIAAALEPPRT
jgi:AcrR family transcriptional regulator